MPAISLKSHVSDPVRSQIAITPRWCRFRDTPSPIMSSQHDDREQDHPDIVRQEYTDPSHFAARWALWSRRTGPPAYDVAFDALLELEPKRVIELGCGPGDFAARVQAAGMQVVAFDQSQQMVDLARARGVDARIGTVEAIPSVEGAFDAAVANFMLYHVADVCRALGELARVAPALVAATMGYDQLREMWTLSAATSNAAKDSSCGRPASNFSEPTMQTSEWSTSQRPSR